MDFSTLKTRVAEETGLDTTTDATKLGAWVNESYRFIAGMQNWPWMLQQKVVQTVADITTGTVTIAAGAASGTFSSAPAASVATDYWIQFTGQSSDWYPISAHTAAQTSFTIGNAFVGSSNYTAGAYIVRKVYYSLASDVDRIVDIRQAISSIKLTYVDPRNLDLLLPNPTATGNPYAYAYTGQSSTNLQRITLYPTPTQVMNLQYRYYQKITDLSASGDLPVIPDKWHMAIVFVALAMFGHPYIDDTRMQSATARARQILEEMLKQLDLIPDKHSVIQAWDTRGGRSSFGPQWPPEYGYPWSR